MTNRDTYLVHNLGESDGVNVQSHNPRRAPAALSSARRTAGGLAREVSGRLWAFRSAECATAVAVDQVLLCFEVRRIVMGSF